METREIKIGKRKFALAFTLGAMEELEKKIENFRLNDLQDYVKSPGGMLDILLALMRQGELLQGRTLDIDRTWLAARMKPAPAYIASVQVAVLEALSDGLSMETEGQNDEEVDLVLEEIKKKETTAE